MVRVPDDLFYKMAFNGALYALGDSVVWQQTTEDNTPEEAALFFRDVFDNIEEGSMPLGSMAYQDADNVDIRGGELHDIIYTFLRDTVAMRRDGGSLNLQIESFGNTSFIRLKRANGSEGSPSATTNNQQIGTIAFLPHEGLSDFEPTSARISGVASENTAAGAHGTKLEFAVTQNGTETVAVALTIHNDKRLEIEGALDHDGATAGVLGATGGGRQTVTGSRGGNAALASLLSAMAFFGWITDSTTA